jgi:hypothetical protein
MADFDLDRDWTPRVASRKKARVDRTPDIQAIQRAAVEASLVTGDDHWDFFLSTLQAKLDGFIAQRDIARALLENSDNFSTADLINEKLAVRLYGIQIDLLKWVMELPNELMEQGEQAKQPIGTVDETAH